MKNTTPRTQPHRISDLVALKEQGADVTCSGSFAVVPVDFQQRENPFQAHVFMCYFSGEADGRRYQFRKCYARGCSHNLCPHVSQAVMIANRYLKKDYRVLKEAGIEMEERLFTLEEMLVQFRGSAEEHGPTLTMDDYIHLAEEGNEVSMAVVPESVPGVEHFANYRNAQTFLMARFEVSCLGGRHLLQQCLACYPTEKEKEERSRMIGVANARLDGIYKEFNGVSIRYERAYFS
jgi:hypothetical protein